MNVKGLLCAPYEAAALSADEVGGKAEQLAWLETNGFAVPAWCVIPAAAVAARAVEGGDIRFSAADHAEIAAWMKRQSAGLGAGPRPRFIVRSSMAGEDGELHSFAGIFESFPNLTSMEAVLAAVEKCLASAHSRRAQFYLENRANLDPVRAAVILQVMIDADKAGVLFTADARDGNRRRFLISALYGAGHGVVGGELSCDEYLIDIQPFKADKRLAHKARCFRAAIGGDGLELAPVPENLRDTSVLDDGEIREIVTAGKRATSLRDLPLDLEWVIAGGKLYLVQVRPAVGLPVDQSPQRTIVFDNSNIQESFSGLTLPLTFSYAAAVYGNVYGQLMKVMGFSASQVAHHERRHGMMLALIRGRVFYNINNWYAGLLLLPSFGRNKQDMEKMMGLDRPVDFVTDHRPGRMEKMRRLPGVLLLVVRLGWAFARIDALVRRFRGRFTATCRGFDRTGLRWMAAQDLFEYFLSLKEGILRSWATSLINDFYVMMAGGRVRRVLEKLDLAGLASDLLCGEELESLQPTLRLMELAQLVRGHPELRRALQAGDREFLAALPAGPVVHEAYADYIELYGDRVAGELKLETRTHREDPGGLLALLRSYVEDENLRPQNFRERQSALRAAAETKVFAAIRGNSRPLAWLKIRSFKKNLAAFRKGMRHREAMRMDRTRSFGMVRSIFRELGRKLVEQGWLKNQGDIFYLTVTEVDEFLFGKAVFADPRPLIELRRSQYAEWLTEKVPPRVTASLPLSEVPATEAFGTGPGAGAGARAGAETSLAGLGCYPGLVEGEVVVLREASVHHDLKGKILVAERTDPGWTPLFAQIKGLVVERGSLLSHSAVIAREMGIPTIVAVPGVTETLKTGERIAMDAGRGTIVREME
jgi:rifampicin phosphotransferase